MARHHARHLLLEAPVRAIAPEGPVHLRVGGSTFTSLTSNILPIDHSDAWRYPL